MERLACGHAINSPAQTHYCDYLRLGDLLKLQPTTDEARHPDEHLFIVTHQAYELWFAQMRFDLPRLIAALDADDVALATWLVNRCNHIIRLFAPMIRVLETMSPSDFYAFREHLNPASGTESSQWPQVEMMLGARDQQFRRQLEGGVLDSDGCTMLTQVWTEDLRALWDSRSVADAVRELFARRGVGTADVYVTSPAENPNGDLVVLSEALLDLDEEWRIWRFVHARTAERAIGSNPGTGNTTGVRYLDYAATHRSYFFPELWEARQTLWQRVQSQPRGE